MPSNAQRVGEKPVSPGRGVGTRLAASEPDSLGPEEQALIRLAQRGDRHAFAVLVQRYWDRLYRWLYHLTHHRESAEDLAQETFLKAFAGLAAFRPESNFRAWLFRIAYNSCLNQQRDNARARQLFPEQLAARGEGPVEAALNREALQLLARAVGRLPQEFRAAFLLRAEEGLAFSDVAAVLGLTEETARWRVFKARQKLMEVLGPHLDREVP